MGMASEWGNSPKRATMSRISATLGLAAGVSVRQVRIMAKPSTARKYSPARRVSVRSAIRAGYGEPPGARPEISSVKTGPGDRAEPSVMCRDIARPPILPLPATVEVEAVAQARRSRTATGNPWGRSGVECRCGCAEQLEAALQAG